MAKLSPAQDKAIRGLSKGEFPLSTNKRTIEALVTHGYVVENNTFFDLTATGREYLGVEESVSEITELLDSNPWDNVTEHATIGDALDHLSAEKWSRTKNAIADLATQASKNLERPFVVREWVATRWVVIPETRSITWGTANVKRNRLKSQGRTVHVLNIQTQQVWA